MGLVSVQFKNNQCFKDHWVGYESIKPVNIIIGKNNTGKSRLLELTANLCGKTFKSEDTLYKLGVSLDYDILKAYFSQGRALPGIGNLDAWRNFGKFYEGTHVEFIQEKGEIINSPTIIVPPKVNKSHHDLYYANMLDCLKKVPPPFCGRIFRCLLSDRDIRPEKACVKMALSNSGDGATNIIRKCITSSTLPEELIQDLLLVSLNRIFHGEGVFRRISVQQHDDTPIGPENDEGADWEVFLREDSKGPISLGRSGSGLKTILLVLLNLLIIPKIEKELPNRYVFGFEELENNLHPSLLRKLLLFIEEFALKHNCPVFLTTHSSVALNLFSGSPHAQIVHITHDSRSSQSKTVAAHFDNFHIVTELGAKPSDILQANGILWLEGPSDCIYMNKWISLITNGSLKEGRDYQCAFYGGSLLARTQFVQIDEAVSEFVNLLNLNINIIVVCDGDRSSKESRIKDRVRRVHTQVKSIPNSHIWITEAREIENYIPGSVLTDAFSRKVVLSDPEKYEPFFPRHRSSSTSYLEAKLGRISYDKIDIASQCIQRMTLENMASRFEWKMQMEKIVEIITRWNR